MCLVCLSPSVANAMEPGLVYSHIPSVWHYKMDIALTLLSRMVADSAPCLPHTALRFHLLCVSTRSLASLSNQLHTKCPHEDVPYWTLLTHRVVSNLSPLQTKMPRASLHPPSCPRDSVPIECFLPVELLGVRLCCCFE